MLREVEQRTGILKKFLGCFVDYRNAEAIEHPVELDRTADLRVVPGI